jgi:hypothetical protein
MLIDVSAVKEFLGIDVNDHDDKIMPLCQSAQAEADKYCDRIFEGSTYIEYLDGNGIDIIQLRNVPIKSITSIYDDLDRVYGADTLINASDYTFNTNTGVVTAIGFVFGDYPNNIKITYIGGYNGIGATSYTALPYDLKQALIYLASAMYLEGQAGVQVMEAQEMVYRPSYLKKEAYKILDTYRLVLV